MAKSRIGGIEALFDKPENNTRPVIQSKGENDRLVIVNFQIPISLKKKIHLYCIQNGISMKDFLTELITGKLNE